MDNNTKPTINTTGTRTKRKIKIIKESKIKYHDENQENRNGIERIMQINGGNGSLGLFCRCSRIGLKVVDIKSGVALDKIIKVNDILVEADGISLNDMPTKEYVKTIKMLSNRPSFRLKVWSPTSNTTPNTASNTTTNSSTARAATTTCTTIPTKSIQKSLEKKTDHSTRTATTAKSAKSSTSSSDNNLSTSKRDIYYDSISSTAKNVLHNIILPMLILCYNSTTKKPKPKNVRRQIMRKFLVGITEEYRFRSTHHHEINNIEQVVIFYDNKYYKNGKWIRILQQYSPSTLLGRTITFHGIEAKSSTSSSDNNLSTKPSSSNVMVNLNTSATKNSTTICSASTQSTTKNKVSKSTITTTIVDPTQNATKKRKDLTPAGAKQSTIQPITSNTINQFKSKEPTKPFPNQKSLEIIKTTNDSLTIATTPTATTKKDNVHKSHLIARSFRSNSVNTNLSSSTSTHSTTKDKVNESIITTATVDPTQNDKDLTPSNMQQSTMKSTTTTTSNTINQFKSKKSTKPCMKRRVDVVNESITIDGIERIIQIDGGNDPLGLACKRTSKGLQVASITYGTALDSILKVNDILVEAEAISLANMSTKDFANTIKKLNTRPHFCIKVWSPFTMPPFVNPTSTLTANTTLTTSTTAAASTDISMKSIQKSLEKKTNNSLVGKATTTNTGNVHKSYPFVRPYKSNLANPNTLVTNNSLTISSASTQSTMKNQVKKSTITTATVGPTQNATEQSKTLTSSSMEQSTIKPSTSNTTNQFKQKESAMPFTSRRIRIVKELMSKNGMERIIQIDGGNGSLGLSCRCGSKGFEVVAIIHGAALDNSIKANDILVEADGISLAGMVQEDLVKTMKMLNSRPYFRMKVLSPSSMPPLVNPISTTTANTTTTTSTTTTTAAATTDISTKSIQKSFEKNADIGTATAAKPTKPSSSNVMVNLNTLVTKNSTSSTASTQLTTKNRENESAITTATVDPTQNAKEQSQDLTSSGVQQSTIQPTTSNTINQFKSKEASKLKKSTTILNSHSVHKKEQRKRKKVSSPLLTSSSASRNTALMNSVGVSNFTDSIQQESDQMSSILKNSVGNVTQNIMQHSDQTSTTLNRTATPTDIQHPTNYPMLSTSSKPQNAPDATTNLCMETTMTDQHHGTSATPVQQQPPNPTNHTLGSNDVKNSVQNTTSDIIDNSTSISSKAPSPIGMPSQTSNNITNQDDPESTEPASKKRKILQGFPTDFFEIFNIEAFDNMPVIYNVQVIASGD